MAGICMCVKITAERTGVSVGAINGTSRMRAFVRARQIAMYAARRTTGASYPMIARHIGRKDHTTVMHAVGRVEQFMAADPEFALVVNDIVAQAMAWRESVRNAAGIAPAPAEELPSW